MESGFNVDLNELRGVISQAGDTVTDVQLGLRQTADSYQNTDDHYATVFGGQQFAQVLADAGSAHGRHGDDLRQSSPRPSASHHRPDTTGTDIPPANLN